jgi:hypothetical protein
MEAFLTPVVARLLSRFVKGAAGGGDAPDLRASLQGGGLALRNLELNLDPFLRGLPVGVRRAFARRLTVSIPWTSLASQPIEVLHPSLYMQCLKHACICRQQRVCFAATLAPSCMHA